MGSVLKYLEPGEAVEPKIWVQGGGYGSNKEAVRVLYCKCADSAIYLICSNSCEVDVVPLKSK